MEEIKLPNQDGSEELLTPTLPDKLEISQPSLSQDKSVTLEETKTSEEVAATFERTDTASIIHQCRHK